MLFCQVWISRRATRSNLVKSDMFPCILNGLGVKAQTCFSDSLSLSQKIKLTFKSVGFCLKTETLFAKYFYKVHLILITRCFGLNFVYQS